MADVLGSQLCGLDLEVDMADDSTNLRFLDPENDREAGGPKIAPPTEMLHEAALRNGITSILDETTDDGNELECIREVCQETLARMDRVAAAKSIAHRQEAKFDDNDGAVQGVDAVDDNASAFSAPKSPQERLMALMPNTTEKGRSKLSRRPSTSYERYVLNKCPQETRYQGDLLRFVRGICSELDDNISKGPIISQFLQLERSQSGQRADLNKGGRGTFVYLCLSKDQTSGKDPISEIIAIFPERGEFVPSDYEVVRRRGVPANINTVGQDWAIYMKVDKSPLDHIADLNSTSGGTEIFLGYKKKSSRSPPPSSTPGKLKQLRSAFASKATEVREQELIAQSLPSSSLTSVPQLPRGKPRKCTKGFDPPVLHAILKALTFIGDFDSSLAKVFEDELVSKIMCAYEATLIDIKPAEIEASKPEQSPHALTRELVVDLIDDISTGAEIATITDNMLGVFKVILCS
ncbi:unnamed protein product [Phytophthora fragariaefolia]|uniref:Unnamed protein product n=1 Tax=Phytophthora fragariaefolia TaxID=1490495 RepID=A0A9W7CQT4_9STRA|nr:unnamed protein product [Phytophthora fragariaefolia]